MESLPERDVEFLNEKGYRYALIPYPGGLYLIIAGFPMTEAYQPEQADMLIMVPVGYPNTPLDMFWTRPDVMRTDGGWPQASLHKEQHNGQVWQRWSRHTEWRAGIDNLRTFIAAVHKELSLGR